MRWRLLLLLAWAFWSLWFVEENRLAAAQRRARDAEEWAEAVAAEAEEWMERSCHERTN